MSSTENIVREEVLEEKTDKHCRLCGGPIKKVVIQKNGVVISSDYHCCNCDTIVLF